ncbi:hypothetical protein BDV19DRAFT_232774 [Aspergillus venezuelensis]
MEPRDQQTATQRVLSLPELLRPILEQIYIDDDTTVLENPRIPPYDAFGQQCWDSDDYTEVYLDRSWTLRSCALVNRTWCALALPILWHHADIAYENDHLWRLHAIQDRARRELYARLVENTRVSTYKVGFSDGNVPLFNEDVVFPRLRFLTILVDFLAPEIPRFAAEDLRELHVDPHCECYPDQWVDKETMGTVLEEIGQRYPNLEVLGFEDRADVRRSDLAKLKARLPKLKSLDDRLLRYVD